MIKKQGINRRHFVFVILLVVLSFTSCKQEKKSVVDAAKFLETASEYGYTLENIKTTYDVDLKSLFGVEVLDYYLLNSEYISIGFLRLQNAEDAKTAYDDYKTDRVTMFESEGFTGKQTKQDHLTKYILKSDDYYIYIGLQDQNVVTILAGPSETSNAEKFIKEIGYN